MVSSRLRLAQVAFVVAVAALLMIGVYFVYTLKSKPYPGANDFYSRWSPTRSFWVDGLNPYGEEASLAIQIGIYGRPVVEGEDPGYFAYPLFTVFLLAPLAPMEYALAEAICLVTLAAALLVALLLLLDLYGWRPRPWLLGLLMLWTLFFYPAARGVLLGQLGLMVYLLEVLTLWALVRGRPVLAGVALALSTLKPQMGFLLVPALLLWGVWERRWRFVGAFTASFGALMALSFLVLPSWLGEWLEQIARYPSYTAIGSPLWVLTRGYLPFLGPTGEALISVGLLSLLGWAWLRRPAHELGWKVSLTLIITHIIALRTATPHFVVFIIPLVFYFKALAEEDRRRGPWVVLLILVTLLVGSWFLFLSTLGWLGSSIIEHPANYIPLPFGMLLVLLLSSRLWDTYAPMLPPPEKNAMLVPLQVPPR